jgi:hypothetical protein
MGAYSNPEILVDTQSGQHWRDLQESINATSRQMTNAFVTRAAENKKKNENGTQLARGQFSKFLQRKNCRRC